MLTQELINAAVQKALRKANTNYDEVMLTPSSKAKMYGWKDMFGAAAQTSPQVVEDKISELITASETENNSQELIGIALAVLALNDLLFKNTSNDE